MSVVLDAPPAAVPAVRPVVVPVRRSKRRFAAFVLATVVLIGAAVGIWYLIHTAGIESTDDAFVDGHVVTISPQVAARVAKVYIDDNKLVKEGDKLVELDPTDFDVAVEQAEATAVAMRGKAEQAKAEIESAKASREEAAASVSVAQANLENTAADLRRFQELSARTPGAVSRQQFDASTAAQKANDASVNEAKAKLHRAESEIVTKTATAVAADGDVRKADADVRKARTNLSYCTIVAPQAGRITRKSVEPGAYVQPGEQLFAIVPAEVWVVANFKETQLTKMRPNQPVTISVDAYPGMELHGHVDSIQSGTGSRFSLLPAENATGNFVKVVQRVPTKIRIDQTPDADRPLVPGMSVEPEVRVHGQ